MFGIKGVSDSIRMAQEQFQLTKQTANDIMSLVKKSIPEMELATSHGVSSGKVIKLNRKQFKEMCETNKVACEQVKNAAEEIKKRN